jgi:tetratricopeptide (TPR) repeat protein
VRDALVEQRIEALARWAGAQLALGLADPVIGELTPALAEHQLAEPLAAVLIRALHAAGRSADALRLYGTFRRRLIDHLGTEPGAELKEVQALLLRGPAPGKPAPALLGSVTDEAPRGNGTSSSATGKNSTTTGSAGLPGAGPDLALPAAARSPAQLPPDVWGFVGRAAEQAELDRLLGEIVTAPGAQPAGAPVATVLSGTAGAGKTALAVHWAHAVRAQFPDGQLYIDLHGYDPLRPRTAAEALAGFLRALGLSDQEIPPEVEERAAAFRTLLFGRRILIVLDNVAEAEQVRLLLPGTPSCLVLMTSRDALAGLVALQGVRRIDVDLLPPADATALLSRLIGDRVRAEPQAAALLVEQCVRLPLTLRVVAEQSVAHPGVSLQSLVDDLRDEHGRLTLLGASTSGTLVRTVFSWSYRCLPAEAARAFRLLSLHPGPDVDAGAAAALLDRPEESARGLLDGLSAANLARSAQPGRYAMHDLLRAYATELAREQDGAEVSAVALDRLLEHYLTRAAAAVTGLYAADPPDSTDPPDSGVADRAWLDAERANLVALSGFSGRAGRPAQAVRLADVLARHLHTVRHDTDALTVYSHACDAARGLGDHGALARMLNGLGAVYQGQGRFEQAIRHYLQAMDQARTAGDRFTLARAVGNLGSVLWSKGQPVLATSYLRWALTLSRQIGCAEGEAAALRNLGRLHLLQAEADEATDHFHEALVLYRRLGDRVGEASTLAALGAAHTHWGNLDVAARFHRRALQVSHDVRDPNGTAYALLGMGLLAHLRGESEKALERHHEALRLHRAIGNRHGEADALNGTGLALRASGDLDQALSSHTAALVLAAELGDMPEQSRAHAGLADAYEAAGDQAQAGHHRDWARRLGRPWLAPPAPDQDALVGS